MGPRSLHDDCNVFVFVCVCMCVCEREYLYALQTSLRHHVKLHKVAFPTLFM